MATDNQKSENEIPQPSEVKTNAPTADKQNNKKPNALNNLLRQIGFAFLFFLLGALVVGLALYLPANSDLRTAEAELERLYPIEAEFTELVAEYEKVSTQRVVYKILANASQMHVALVNEDNSRIAQYLGYIEDDLAKLSIADFPEIPASLQDQLGKVSDKRLSDKAGAIEALQVLQNDLLLLIDNLE